LPESVSFSQCDTFFNISARPIEHNAYILQAVKDVRGSEDTLIDAFERIEGFFRRLEIYTQVPPSTEMMDTIVRIMVEVLSILGIATKEIKQGRMSE
jgi:hypothetical protein